MNQMDIFDLMYEPLKINKPIRTLEFFGGYGSQLLALKYLGANVEQWKLCEWAVKSIQAYKDIHFENDNTDYSKELTIEEVKQYLYDKGISQNYNEPMSKEQVWRLNEESARKIYNNIQATHNLVNIQQVGGGMLDIIDKDKYTYLLTYSFPCQDISNAGNKAGFEDTSTRSGMLWEVERILKECKELDQLPQILLMENVPLIHSVDNMPAFSRWTKSLEDMGYKNYYQDLIAIDYGIPQTRNRCFMVSVLGNYKYTFPETIPLEKKLKDLLEDNVDEKYYLSEDMIKYIVSDNESYTGNNDKSIINRDIASTITTREGNGRADTSDYICNDRGGTTTLKKNLEMVIPNLKIKNATEKGYLEAEDGDGIDISSRMQYHRGTVQKGKAQTITTMGGENVGVLINMKNKLCNELIETGKVKENDVIRHSYTNSRFKGEMKDLKQNNISPTLDTRCDCLGVVVDDR
jgi:DNA (cytosine-5)-methyltransferase 1